jgi:hypothetical protein
LNTLAKHLTRARLAVPARSISADLFKSRAMIDHVRLHEFLDQLVFSARLRFQLHVRLLHQATLTLTTEFHHTCRYVERTEDRSSEVWGRLDFYFHDFDLIAKETLLALRALLSCLSQEALAEFASDLNVLVQHGVRTPAASMNEPLVPKR